MRTLILILALVVACSASNIRNMNLVGLEDTLSANTRKQLKITPYDSLGNKMWDAETGAMMSITYEHHEIHSGSHFYNCGYSTLASGDSLDFQVTTPNTSEWAHMTFQFEGTQQTIIEVFEGASVDADGTPVTAYNNDRNSAHTTSFTLLQEGGTVNTVGTLIYSQSVGVAGNANKAQQGFSDRQKELILKQNTTYRFVVTSGGSGNLVAYCGEWYEHTNKN